MMLSCSPEIWMNGCNPEINSHFYAWKGENLNPKKGDDPNRGLTCEYKLSLWGGVMGMVVMVLPVVVAIVLLSFFGRVRWLGFRISWDSVNKGSNGKIIKMLEGFQGLNHSTHGRSASGSVAEALISQSSSFSCSHLRILTFKSRIHNPPKFSGIIQHWPCPFH